MNNEHPAPPSQPSLNHEELVRLSDLNFWEAYRDMTRRSRHGTLLEENGLLLHAGGHPCPVIVNGAKRIHDALPAEEILAQADAYFGARGHGYTINIRLHADQDLEEAVMKAGFSLALELPVMVADHRLPEPAEANCPEIEQVATERHRQDFIQVVSESFEVHPAMAGMVQSVFGEPQSLLAPHIAAFVAYQQGEPVSAAMAMVSYGVAFVGWVSTRPAYRGRGFGEAVTREATNAGFDLGARIASLQASPLGEPLYRRLGYTEITRYREYMPPFPGAA